MTRVREIEEKCPDLAVLTRERQELVMRAARSAFSAVLAADVEEKMAGLNEKIVEGLKKAGYPVDYLSPIFDCADRQDTGYVYAGSVRTPRACLKRRYMDALARTGADLVSMQTFENFDESRCPATM